MYFYHLPLEETLAHFFFFNTKEIFYSNFILFIPSPCIPSVPSSISTHPFPTITNAPDHFRESLSLAESSLPPAPSLLLTFEGKQCSW